MDRLEASTEKCCEQCQQIKPLTAFRKHNNKTDGRTKRCAACYRLNLQEQRQRQEEIARLMEQARQRQEEERQRQEEYQRQQTQRQQALDAWYQQQPARMCLACKQTLPASAFDASTLEAENGVYLPTRLRQRCKSCHEAYRKKNRQIYPLCPMCGSPTRVGNFLRAYMGYQLDIIRVCCQACIPLFEALPPQEQRWRIQRAMTTAYGESAAIYALHYDASDTIHHIGRTKHLTRRISEYRRNWYRDIDHYSVLQEVTPGALSMEHESRWILHALKHGWPIDNFDMFTEKRHPTDQERNQDGETLVSRTDSCIREQSQKAFLCAAIADLEPLTAPFEQIDPLLSRFSNTGDARIAHWFQSQ